MKKSREEAFDFILAMSEKINQSIIENKWEEVIEMEKNRSASIKEYFRLVGNDNSVHLRAIELLKMNETFIKLSKKFRQEVDRQIQTMSTGKKANQIYRNINVI